MDVWAVFTDQRSFWVKGILIQNFYDLVTDAMVDSFLVCSERSES